MDQLAIRLLIPAGSRLLDLPEVRGMVGPFDSAALVFPWKHEDPRVDALCKEISGIVQRGDALKLSRSEIFSNIWRAAHAAAGILQPRELTDHQAQRVSVPFLDEPWYCCAEPMDIQFVSIGKMNATPAKADQYV